MSRLMREVSWRRDCVQVFGRSHPIPRLHQWYGDPGSEYRWSGLTMRPEPWTATLHDLRIRVSEAVGHDFNSVLVNLYRDGGDSMGWHADDEPELGDNPTIASVSLGAERDLKLRYRQRDAREANRTISLESGSLLVMAGMTQRFWQHSLPKRRRVTEPRINLTFRRII
jgi:alkylated DNA repair dioxygenase AlkB